MTAAGAAPDPPTDEARIQTAMNLAAKSLDLAGRAEEQLRLALRGLVGAIDPAREAVKESHAHEVLHVLGRVARRTYGCRLTPAADGGYGHSCAVALAHLAFGWSPALVYTVRCSVCGRLAEECEHIEGERYGDETCQYEREAPLVDVCSICLKILGRCHHEVGREYDGKVCGTYKQATDALREHVPLVKSPRLGVRQSRPHTLHFTREQVVEQMGPDWSPARGVGCDLCLHDCPGFVTLEERETVPVTWLAPLDREASLVGGLHVTLDAVVVEDWWHTVASNKGWTDLFFQWGFGTLVIVGRNPDPDRDAIKGLYEIVDGAFMAVDDLDKVIVAPCFGDEPDVTSVWNFGRDDLPLTTPGQRSQELYALPFAPGDDPNRAWLPPH